MLRAYLKQNSLDLKQSRMEVLLGLLVSSVGVIRVLSAVRRCTDPDFITPGKKRLSGTKSPCRISQSLFSQVGNQETGEPCKLLLMLLWCCLVSYSLCARVSPWRKMFGVLLLEWWTKRVTLLPKLRFVKTGLSPTATPVPAEIR